MNRVIRRKLIKVEHPLRSIKQWYKRPTNLDKHWSKSRWEEERLRRRREIEALAQRTNILATAGKI